MTNRFLGRKYRWCAIALGLSLVIAGSSVLAEDATFELSKDVPTAVKLIAEAVAEGDASGEGSFPFYTQDRFTTMTRYGNWYGPGWSGGIEGSEKPGNEQPVDALDAIAMKHDFGYEYAEEQGKLHGKEYEYLLKAMADQIAVRDAKLLPKDPRSWDPPAADPDTAGRYRDRIQFGFQYWAQKHQLQGDAATVASAFKYLMTQKGLPKVDEATLEAEAEKRAAEWYTRDDVKPIYRVELSAPRTLIAEMESISITGRLVPVKNAGAGLGPAERVDDVNLSVSGPAGLSSTTLSPGVPVILTATHSGFFSINGDAITVTASLESDVIEVVESVLKFTVAAWTNMTLAATPEVVEFYGTAGESDQKVVTFNAKLTDAEGNGVVGVPVQLTQEGGGHVSGVTGAGGVAAMPIYVLKSLVGDEHSKKLAYSVTTTGTRDSSGNVYMPSTASTFIELTNYQVVMVSGSVYDVRSGNALKGASVEIDGPEGPETAVTDSSGRFSIGIARIPMSTYVTAPGQTQYIGSVSKAGYDSETFIVQAQGGNVTVRLRPLLATVVGQVIDAGTKPGEGGLLDGATVKVTQPFETLIFTQGGKFTLADVYVGDTLTMTADAINHKAYTKSGVITMENVSITFRLPVGKGNVSGVLEEEAASDTAQGQNLPKYHDMMILASPASPGPYQAVRITAQIFPANAGVLIEISMHGTDGYNKSKTAMTDAMGKVTLDIPGAAPGVRDDVVARIIGEGVYVVEKIKYSFK